MAAKERPLELHFRPLSADEAHTILSWRYPPPYELYNADPDDEEARAVAAFLDPANAYYAILDGREGLAGYCCYGPDARVPGGDYRGEALDIGLGMRPDLTGQGYGRDFVGAVVRFGEALYRAAVLRVTIAELNVRAQNVWVRAGFGPAQRFARADDGLAFVVLTRLSSSQTQMSLASLKE